jgi:hypothetical protein
MVTGAHLRWKTECELHGWFETENKPIDAWCGLCHRKLEPERLVPTNDRSSVPTEKS